MMEVKLICWASTDGTYMGGKYSCIIFITQTKPPLLHTGEKEIFQQNPEKSREEAQYKIIALNYLYRREKTVISLARNCYLGQNLILVILTEDIFANERHMSNMLDNYN